jgi:glutathione S-transferase
MIAPHANLVAWIERVKARPSMAATEWDVLLERFPVMAAEPVVKPVAAHA